MKTLKQFSIILTILFFGQVLQQRYNLSVPGTVIGMMVLLFLLIIKVIKVEKIDSIAKTLLEHLTLFFVPSVVGIMTLFNRVKDIWGSLLIISFTSTIVVMVVTGLTIQFLNKHISNKDRRELRK